MQFNGRLQMQSRDWAIADGRCRQAAMMFRNLERNRMALENLQQR